MIFIVKDESCPNKHFMVDLLRTYVFLQRSTAFKQAMRQAHFRQEEFYQIYILYEVADLNTRSNMHKRQLFYLVIS